MAYTNENKSELLEKFSEVGEVIERQTRKFKDRDATPTSQKDLSDEIKYVQRELDDLYKRLWR